MTKMNLFFKILALLQLIGLCLSLTQTEPFNPPISIDNYQGNQKFSDIMMMKNDGGQDDFNIPSQTFEEKVSDNERLLGPKLSPDKISLSMGNVLSSLNIAVTAMVLSKDRKTAFATLDFYGTLKVIDISDMKTPFIVSSLNLKISGYEYRIKSLTLSSDEKTLYISNSRDLEIIDVSYFGAPKLISLTSSRIFYDDAYLKVSKYFKTSLALDERTMTLFIGGIGLQVYNVSNPKIPTLLNAWTNNLDDSDPSRRATYWRNEIFLSHDGQFLFIANGTLDVYNISNPKKIQLVSSLQASSLPRSMFLHQDSKTALLLGRSLESLTIILEEVDLSDPKSPVIRNTYELGYTSTFGPRILAVSPSKSKVFIFKDEDYEGYGLLVFDLEKKTTAKNPKNLIDSTQAMVFSPDGKYLITGSNDQLMIVELYTNYPNKEIFSGSLLDVVSNFSRPSLVIQMELSPDGSLLYLLRSERKMQSFDFFGIFEIFDMKDINEPKFLGSYAHNEVPNAMHFGKNENTVYLVSLSSLLVLDISTKSSPTLKKTLWLDNSLSQGFKQIVVTSDERIGIIAKYHSGIGYLMTLDLSEASEIKEILTWEKNFTDYNCKMLLLDDQNLLVIDKEVFIYDISDVQSPRLTSSLPIGVNEPDPLVKSYALSPDNKTLFIETADVNEFTKLRIYDISDFRAPKLVIEKPLSKYSAMFFKPAFSLSLDMKSGYVFQENSLVRFNLADLKQPKVSGIIPLSQKANEQISNYRISPDGQWVYVVADSRNIRIMNLNIRHSLYLKQEKIRLGEKYSDYIAMLCFADRVDYDLMDTSAYKVIKLSVLDIKVAPNKYSLDMTTPLLPSWIAFDKESNLLTLEPKKQRDLGTYILHSRFSLKIPEKIFDEMSPIGKPISSEDLLAWLISLDFVDNQLYLTGNFGSIDTFYLPAQFSEYKTKIYNTLKKFYIETSTTFEVVPSLEVKSDNNLFISTLSTSSIKVEIILQPRGESEAKFLYKPYASVLPSIKDTSKTQATLEGELKDINAALMSIVVNFEGGDSCDALLTVIDGLNPAVTVTLNGVSRYFKPNKAPMESREPGKTVQEQIDKADIETGKYFTFTLSGETFADDDSESLTYEIATAKNDTALPTWLSLSGLTLKGTPPEEILGREVELILIAKNEFKQFGVPFKLHIRVSAVLALKLILRYSPYILTLLGLFVSANKIFNVIGKKYYRHPREFFVNVGEEIGNGVIFPVMFLKEENKQGQMVLKQMMKKIPKRELSEYFVDRDSGRLNREKILNRIQEAIMEMPSEQRKMINVDRRALIGQIIMNKFVFMYLNSEREMRTKLLFEDLVKAGCLEVVERDVVSGEFIINQRKLNSLILKIGQRIPGMSQENILDHNGCNMDLLEDAILAFAFEKHSLDSFAVNVNISVKQLIKSKSCWSFFKLDLKRIYFNENNKIDYGLNYRVEDDKLCFYGVAKRNLGDKTLVVQITNKRHKILKEIWIRGVSPRVDSGDESFVLQDEGQARGQGYEVF